MATDVEHIRLALRLARRALGETSPNPMVGAVLVSKGRIIGCGWHRQAGGPHAEIEALEDARGRGESSQGATLYVTLEPCCTQGRTPPCTAAILAAGIRKVVVGATDPNPRHRGQGLKLLRVAGAEVVSGVLERQCSELNQAFNHWIVRRAPFVTVKAAMTLDGKIATASGESKWITGRRARAWGMRLRREADAILVGISTLLQDDPSLTCRLARGREVRSHKLRRIILDARGRTPLTAKVVTDSDAGQTTIVVSELAAPRRVAALSRRVRVLLAPLASNTWAEPKIDLDWLLKTLGAEEIVSLLVEGGGEVNSSFLLRGHAQRVAFFYAPKIIGGSTSRPAVAGRGAESLRDAVHLSNICWRRLGPDWLLLASVAARPRRSA